MLLGASQIRSSTSLPYAFTSMRPQRQRVLPITAAAKVRPPAKRSTPKQAGGRAAPKRGAQQGRGSSPSRGGLGGLFGGAKKAASAPKQAAKKVASSAKKVAPAGTRRVGGTKKVGTKRVGGTSKIGTKRTGVAPPPSGRIQFDEDTSSTLGAAGVFSLGLATSAFLLFSVFTGIEGPAEAEQVVQGAASAVQSIVRSGVNEVGTLAASDSPAEQEDTKIADLAEKAKKAAEQVPSDARSAPSPQVGDASPTGKAGIFGFGKQDPSKAEDTQVPNVGEGANKALGQKSTPTSTSIGSAPTNEVAKVAENPIEAAVEKTEEAAESAVRKVPSPNGLVENVEEAIEGTSTFKATAPVGSEGKVSNLADQGLKGGAKFEEAASKLSGNSAKQYEASTELDKQLQKEDDFKRASQFKADSPGSDAGNSVIGRLQSQITSKGTSENAVPQAPSSSFGPGAAGTKNPGGSPVSSTLQQASSSGSPNNTNLLIGGGVLVLGVIAAAASQGQGGEIQKQVSQAVDNGSSSGKEGGPSVGVSGQDSGDSGTGQSGASGAKGGDVKEDIANRKEEAKEWISEWKDRTGGK